MRSMKSGKLGREFLSKKTLRAARGLLGKTLCVKKRREDFKRDNC